MVAPFESCVACYRGDTTTALVIQGEAGFAVAFLNAQLGIPAEDAEAMIQMFAEQDLGGC